MDGLLTAVFDAYALHEQPEQLLKEGHALPLFCDHLYHVSTDEEKARRVWTGLEKRLSHEALKLISVSWLSELSELPTPLFQYIYIRCLPHLSGIVKVLNGTLPIPMCWQSLTLPAVYSTNNSA